MKSYTDRLESFKKVLGELLNSPHREEELDQLLESLILRCQDSHQVDDGGNEFIFLSNLLESIGVTPITNRATGELITLLNIQPSIKPLVDRLINSAIPWEAIDRTVMEFGISGSTNPLGLLKDLFALFKPGSKEFGWLNSIKHHYPKITPNDIDRLKQGEIIYDTDFILYRQNRSNLYTLHNNNGEEELSQALICISTPYRGVLLTCMGAIREHLLK